MAAAAPAIDEVRGRAGLKRFLAVPAALYRDDPFWVQPLTFERLMHLDVRKNPFLDGIEIAWFVASRDGRDVGRISAQINRKHLDLHQDATGHFGFFEAIDDPAVAKALTDTATAWLRARGMQRIAGPFDPSINDQCGLLVEGFDTIPSMMMGHHRQGYGPALEALGYRKEKDLICYWFDVQAPWPAAAAKLIERTGRQAKIHFRPLNMKRYADEIRVVCDIFNDAWSENWGFVPFSEAEAQYLASSIRPIISAHDFVIGELDDVPVAMVGTLPNLNHAIRDLHGSILPFGWAKLLWRLKVSGVPEWRMPLMGVRKAVQATSKGAALALGVIRAVKDSHAARGTKGAELSWVLEDNKATDAVVRLVGGRPYKRYRIYGRDLA